MKKVNNVLSFFEALIILLVLERLESKQPSAVSSLLFKSTDAMRLRPIGFAQSVKLALPALGPKNDKYRHKYISKKVNT